MNNSCDVLVQFVFGRDWIQKINNLQQISSIVQATMIAQFFSVDCFNDLEHNPETNFIDFGYSV